MIGQGTIVIKRGLDKNELHFVSPWELSLALHDAQNKDDIKGFDRSVLKQAKIWKPDAVVSDAEVEAIKKATSAIPNTKGYHKYASDVVHVINGQGTRRLANDRT